MYATILSTEDNNTSIVIKNPNWVQIKNIILALNGLNRNIVTIGKTYEEREYDDDIKEFMSIAGGGDNQFYICTIYSYEDRELVLYDPSKSWEEDIEIVRVFPTIVPACQCFNLDPILTAAETYSRFGQREKSLHWGYYSLNESSELEIIEVKS